MYWFILGREKLLSAAEIAAVLGFNNVNWNEIDQILKCSTPIVDAAILMGQLGGTIKIGQEIGADLTEEEMMILMARELTKIEGKIHFGISIYGNESARQVGELGKKVKQRLKKDGRSVRHVFNMESVLSSVAVEKNGLTKRGCEFLITRAGNKFAVAKTLAVQPFETFSARDYGRPGRDDLSGMLPPKLAMMMINYSQIDKNAVMLDPFCGSGTILTEAMLMGYENLIGMDNSHKAISDTEKNVNWIKEQYQLEARNLQIFVGDATKLTEKIPTKSVDAIITEPFLGKPLRGNEGEEEIKKQADELKKLYLAALSEFTKILKPKGKVIFIIPRFNFKNNWVTIDLQSELKKLGLKVMELWPNKNYLLYARPNQRVGREIWGFEKI